MIYLGLTVSIFIFATIILFLIAYIAAVIFHHPRFAAGLMPYMFIHLLFSVFILSWALVVMNQGFDIILGIRIDYTVLFFIILPLIPMIFIPNHYIRKEKYVINSRPKKIYRALLPLGIFVLFSIAIVIFFFTCHYFVFLLTW